MVVEVFSIKLSFWTVVFSCLKNCVHPPSQSQEICSLENQIHRVAMNLMEAEHVKKKYQIIQSSLQEDGVAFENSLVRIEEAIRKQESEIRHLKVSACSEWAF
jgi:hypothetical protein